MEHLMPNRIESPTRVARKAWVGLLLCALVALLSACMGNGGKPVADTCLVAYPGRTFSYKKQFNDNQSRQIRAAQALGLSAPLRNREEAQHERRHLREVRSCDNFIVDELTHSVPYLVPKAADELQRIGEGFGDILARNDLPHYRFHVSSVLRTEDDVRRLQKSGNINSVTRSCHCYGTTFDLTYTDFEKTSRTGDYMTPDNLKLVLAQVLLNEQRAGRIYVKYEWQQACFHITVRP